MGVQEIKPIERCNCVDQVFEQMRSMLFEGTWGPGEKIPSENELARLFNVSRPTVRQAIQKLKAQDLLETRTGMGSFVKQFDAGEFTLNELIPVLYLGNVTDEQVFEFREMVEVESVKLAARSIDEQTLERLDLYMSRMNDAASAKDEEAFSENDLLFHRTIVEATRNPLIIKSYQILEDVLAKSMTNTIKKMKFVGMDYHVRILDSLKKHDGDTASNDMRAHIRNNIMVFSK